MALNNQDKPKKVEDVSNKPKSVNDIIAEQIQTGLSQHQRKNSRLFASSLAAGMEIGFSLFAMAIFYTIFYEKINGGGFNLIVAIGYSFGFIFVVIGRSELFTEHTTLAVLPVLNKKASFINLIKIWGIIYLGNLLGGYLFTFIILWVGPTMGTIDPKAFLYLAEKMLGYNWLITIGSGIIAGWLMGLLSWLVSSAQETISRIVIVFIISTLIGLGGLHHAIAGSVEVFAGLILEESINISDYLHFQLWTTVGNIVGGVVFVAVIKYSTADTEQ